MPGRRRFLRLLGGIAAGVASSAEHAAISAGASQSRPPAMRPAARTVTLFLCGDVMTGRAIDQILPHPSKPQLHEAHMNDGRGYLALAEQENGGIPHPVPFDYVWGDALAELQRRQPDIRFINLETSVTRSDTPWPKGINYRMHPGNVGCLSAAGIHACTLANNHVLDWQREGLAETLATLHGAKLAIAGAGRDRDEAQAPAILPLGDGARLLVFAAATDDSGVPAEWAATDRRSGVHRLPDLSPARARRLAALIKEHRRPGDCVMFSVHWGGNWGYAVPRAQRDFAHALIDGASVDVVHGHSSHHPKGIEVYRGRLILYGCGDFLNDYEGIAGHEEYRGELGLMYFPTLERASGRLRALALVPTRIRRFRVNEAGAADRAWLLGRLQRECRIFDCDVEAAGQGAFGLRWKD